ncbi:MULTISPECIES: lysylphosphatidylglycerol synthase domain-containing protein [unclassified Blastococcus]
MRRRAWAAARLLGGVLVLAVVVWRVGPDAFLDGVRGLGPGTLLAALAIGAAVTVCSAWRWRVVAAGLGVVLPLPGATAAYYRSQFLNSTLPGGVVGDVHRGLRSGLDAGDLGRGLRAVVWERAAGQLVQVAVAVAVLLLLPSPVRGAVPGVVAAAAGAAALLALTGRGVTRHGPARLVRALRAAVAEGREVLLRPAAVGPVLLASLLVVAGHLAMFWLAARAAGVDAAPQRLLPLALVVLLAAAIPFNVAGWGPREGAAAWVFAGTAGGAAAGAAVAAAFGVLTLVAVLPGVVVLLAGRRPAPPVPPPAPVPAPAPLVHSGTGEDGAAHG